MQEALAPFGANGMIQDIVEAQAEVFERGAQMSAGVGAA